MYSYKLEILYSFKIIIFKLLIILYAWGFWLTQAPCRPNSRLQSANWLFIMSLSCCSHFPRSLFKLTFLVDSDAGIASAARIPWNSKASSAAAQRPLATTAE